jgi:hypothetical protein
MKSTTTLWDIMEEVAINKYKEQDKTPYPDDGVRYFVFFFDSRVVV